MDLAFSIACFIVGALAFLNGFVTEYRQSRRIGPYAIVPTLPWAVPAASFVVFGLWFVPYNIPWWSLPLAFIGAVVVFGYGIMLATRDSSQRD
jgi:MFS-type transporter involved in bile tolerance (Atg22 family)